jgi:hypothetical protein
MEKIRIAVESVVEALGIGDSTGKVYLEETETPWNEKVLVKRKKEHLDVKLTLWKDNLFLYGRIYRLLLYVYDMLNREFGYNSQKIPREDGQLPIRELYTQIWSIYVDSRVEKEGIASFYDRTMRRNLFIDVRRDLSWEEGFALFDKLWTRTSYNHEEIIRYAYNLDELLRSTREREGRSIEVELHDLLKEHSVSKHLKRISSDRLRKTANEIINFTAYNCKGILIRSSYYGICFEFEKRAMGEMIPMDKMVVLTLLQSSQEQKTFTITEMSDPGEFQTAIRKTFQTYSDASVS